MSTTDTLEIRQLARQFAESELRPHVEKWDHESKLDDAVLAQLAELGFFSMLVPEAQGGMAFDLPVFVSALEEIAWGDAGVALLVALANVAAHVISTKGSDAQKRQWLESLSNGSVLFCIAQAEEDGSALEVRRDGEHWLLNGTRKWVTAARSARTALVPVNGSVLLAPMDTNGITVQQRVSTMGLRDVDIADVRFDNVRLAADNAIANVARVQGNVEDMLAIAAIAVGIAQAALDHARGYADVREQFHEKLRSFEGIQFKLADMRTRTEAARALLEKAAADPDESSAAMAKLFASEAAMYVSTQAVQIFGGYGYMRDYPVEKLMRDAKATEMLGGPNEIQRVRIARNLYEQ